MLKRCICASLHPVLSHAPRDKSNWVKAGSAAEGDFMWMAYAEWLTAAATIYRRIPYYMYQMTITALTALFALLNLLFLIFFIR